jgi:hypothetical protein
VYRLVHALHGESSEIVEAEVPGDERRRGFGEIYLARLSEVLHPRRETDRVPLRRIVHAQVVADLPYDHLTRIQTHAHGEVQTVITPELLGVAPQLLLKLQRRVAGTLRAIFVRNRGAKERHDPVAGVLVDRPLEAVNAVGKDVEKTVEDAVPLLGIDLLG